MEFFSSWVTSVHGTTRVTGGLEKRTRSAVDQGQRGWNGESSSGRTLLAQQEGVKAQVVDGQVQPALPRHSALPVAAGVIIHQLLLIRHPKQPPHLQLSFQKLCAVLHVLLALLQTALLSNDALQEAAQFSSRNHAGGEKQRLEEKRTYADLSFDKGDDVFITFKDRDGLQQVGLQPVPVFSDLLPGRA